MLRWKKLIESFNNACYVKRDGFKIYFVASNFAKDGIQNKLKELDKIVLYEWINGEIYYYFDSSLKGKHIAIIDKFFNS